MDDETGGNPPYAELRAKLDAARDRRTQIEQTLAEAEAELEDAREKRRRLREALEASDEVVRKLVEEALDAKGKVTRG